MASKALIADANLDIAGLRNITLTGELDSGSLDISGNADVDGTLSVGSINDIEATINSISAGTGFGSGSLGVTVANIGIGENALTDDNLTGTKNLAIGYQSMRDTTSGAGNTAVGYTTLSNNTTGYSNSAFGSEVLSLNTTGAILDLVIMP